MRISRAATVGLAWLVLGSSLVVAGEADAVLARPARAARAVPPHPVPRVVAGTVDGARRGAALRGTVTVRNAGQRRMPADRLIVQLVLGSTAEQVGVERVRRLGPGRRRVVAVRMAAPAWLPTGRHVVRVCYATSCKNVGTMTRTSVPAEPGHYTADTPFVAGTGANRYEIVVPSGYDPTHRTPTQLFVWLHGCGGESSGDIYNVAPERSQSDIVVAPLAREDACWNMATDPATVMAVVADVRSHFNIDPRRLVLGGYSSGGDLAYRTAFYGSGHVAGILVCNTSPFRDTGSSAAASLRAATFRFRTVHLAHTEDEVYPIAGVRSEIKKMTDAGFSVKTIEVAGTHYDDPSAGVPGTDADIATYLLPHLGDRWLSPAR